MGEPGDQRGDQDCDQRLAAERFDDFQHHLQFAERRRVVDDQPQRQQHQSEAEPETPEIPGSLTVARQEGDQTERDQDRRQPGDLEAEELGDQRGADIRPQHDRQRRRRGHQPPPGEGCGHQTGCRAALQQRGHADPRQQRREAVAEVAAEKNPQPAAEGTRHTGPHHPHRPDQQGDGADEVNQDKGRRDGAIPPGLACPAKLNITVL